VKVLFPELILVLNNFSLSMSVILNFFAISLFRVGSKAPLWSIGLFKSNSGFGAWCLSLNKAFAGLDSTFEIYLFF
jgi:hypothetical protein